MVRVNGGLRARARSRGRKRNEWREFIVNIVLFLLFSVRSAVQVAATVRGGLGLNPASVCYFSFRVQSSTTGAAGFH